MSFDPLSAAFELGKVAIEKIWPDPTKRAEELRKLEGIRQKGDLALLNAHVQLMLGQIEINKEEAKHKSLFVAGWRPFIGWVGGLALAYKYIVYEFVVWGWSIAEASAKIPDGVQAPPTPDAMGLMPVIMGMLGIGAMRSYDKSKGTQTDSLGNQ